MSEVITSHIRASSEEYRANAAHMTARCDELAGVARRIRMGGGEAARERHAARGKLLPRERIARLLDPGSPFLEIGLFAAHEVYEEPVPCAALIAGVGLVMGRPCMAGSHCACPS